MGRGDSNERGWGRYSDKASSGNQVQSTGVVWEYRGRGKSRGKAVSRLTDKIIICFYRSLPCVLMSRKSFGLGEGDDEVVVEEDEQQKGRRLGEDGRAWLVTGLVGGVGLLA
jgi:hypothetical protein